MEMIYEGIKIYILLDNAVCIADEENRSPIDIIECPCGYDICTLDCRFYTEGS